MNIFFNQYFVLCFRSLICDMKLIKLSSPGDFAVKFITAWYFVIITLTTSLHLLNWLVLDFILRLVFDVASFSSKMKKKSYFNICFTILFQLGLNFHHSSIFSLQEYDLVKLVIVHLHLMKFDIQKAFDCSFKKTSKSSKSLLTRFNLRNFIVTFHS